MEVNIIAKIINIITGIRLPASIKEIVIKINNNKKDIDINSFPLPPKDIGTVNIPNKENIKMKPPAINSLLKNPV